MQTHCASPGNFFTGAKQFVISGGEFTSVTNLITNAVPEAGTHPFILLGFMKF
jgi:hypothetical protein